MKKLILLTIIILGGINFIYSQKIHANSFNKKDSVDQIIIKTKPKPEHVYVVFTSQEDGDGITEGVKRIKTCYPYTNDTTLISYIFFSKSKDFRFVFRYWNHNVENLKRPIKPNDKMSVVMVSKKFLSNIKPIDLDAQGPSMTKEEALALRDRLVGKVIWVIDRRDITRDSVKLIQTETTIPECF